MSSNVLCVVIGYRIMSYNVLCVVLLISLFGERRVFYNVSVCCVIIQSY